MTFTEQDRTDALDYLIATIDHRRKWKLSMGNAFEDVSGYDLTTGILEDIALRLSTTDRFDSDFQYLMDKFKGNPLVSMVLRTIAVKG